MPPVTFPFGKHQGRPVTAVPSHYLLWMLERWKDEDPAKLRTPLGQAMRADLATRLQLEPRVVEIEIEPPARPAVPESLKGAIDSIIATGFRARARAAHPDTGGNDAAMRALIESREWLREVLFGEVPFGGRRARGA